MRRISGAMGLAVLLVSAGCGTHAPTAFSSDAASDASTVTDVAAPTDLAPGTDVPTTDANNPADVGNLDATVSMDTPQTGTDGATDVAEDDGASEDLGAPYNPCLPAAVINLNTAGTRTGSTTQYMGNNNGVGGMSPLTTTCTTQVGHEVVLSYTVMTSSELRVSTDNAGTSSTFDTVVWVQDACSPTAMELGCNDDSDDTGSGDGGAGLENASVLDTSIVPAGTTVYIVVSGYTPSSEPGTLTETGAYVLTVTELASVAVGGRCDPTGDTNYCAAGSSCVGTTTGTCIADGTLDGVCLTTPSMPPCASGLGCSPAGICVAATPVGSACDADTSVCATGSTCEMAATAMLCVADGTLYGACSSTSPACGAGLACNPDEGVCVMGVALGAACDPAGVLSPCAFPNQCVTTGPSSVCTPPPYAQTSLTAPTWIDACGTGGAHIALKDIDASNPRDDNHSAMAVTIPFTFQFLGAGITQVWPDTNGFLTMGPTEPPDDSTGELFPALDEPALVAPFWEDLILGPVPGSDLCSITAGTAPHRQFVVEWLDAGPFGLAGANLTFEVVFNETTNTVDFVYNSLSDPGMPSPLLDGSEASIGLQTASGAQYAAYMGTVSTTAGLRFTPE